MANPSDVSMQEVNDAFYKSYGEGSPGGLKPGLLDPKTKGRRKLTLAPADAEFRECWMETRRLMREAKGYCPPKGAAAGAPLVICPLKSSNSDRPEYKPDLWNDGGAIQNSTNCYAYAMDSRTGHPPGKPQPGERPPKVSAKEACPGDPRKRLCDTCKSVSAAVAHDGKPNNILLADRCPYNKQEKKPPPEKSGYYLVALVVTSRPDGYDATDKVEYVNDYHWYRQGKDGSWSHKPGSDPVSSVDSDGIPISNPETAARKSVYKGQGTDDGGSAVDLVIDYDIFCGYFYVKKGGVKVGP
jgi:hypothetical protein